jgi:uncharacterized protein (DUF885 family)
LAKLLTHLLCGSLLSATVFIGCSDNSPRDQNSRTSISSDHIQSETQRLNDWFAARYKEGLKRKPLTQTYLGLKEGQDKLDDVSQAALDEEYALKSRWLAEMKREYNFDRLDKQGKISYRLFEYNADIAAKTRKFESNDYVFNHMSGPHTYLPTFMVNFHAVNSVEDARAYVARLQETNRYLGQFKTRAEDQAARGVLLPQFVYDKLITASKNIISGGPFENTPDSPVLADFKVKVGKLNLNEGDRAALVEQAEDALLGSFRPGYEGLIAMFEAHQAMTNDQDGAWKLPNGADYYNTRLNYYTTTELSADEIHDIGLAEVARIQDEMRGIMKQVGFEADLKAFYAFLRTDPQFTYSNDDEGRAKYMSEATKIINEMRAVLNDLFITKPKANFVVKRVEPFREASSFGAFYDRPAADGSRPGTYFVNLMDVREQPIYLMQALAYHEGIPGHHMQIALAMELENIPEFRKQGGYTSYTEGWALYAESIAAELGMYTDPYKDFGRLSMEIFRAARLVVDTGIHSKKWTREQAVQYMMDNIANPEGDIRAEVDRYIVWPGQATAYKIGMLKITELKKDAQTRLGDSFDIREFHDIILANGAVPLAILEELVEEWIVSKS